MRLKVERHNFLEVSSAPRKMVLTGETVTKRNSFATEYFLQLLSFSVNFQPDPHSPCTTRAQTAQHTAVSLTSLSMESGGVSV